MRLPEGDRRGVRLPEGNWRGVRLPEGNWRGVRPPLPAGGGRQASVSELAETPPEAKLALLVLRPF